jgi:UV DNA damage repair endonuclease
VSVSLNLPIVITVQLRLKNYLTGMKGRLELLKKMWTKEHYKMVMSLAKNKNKTKRQKDFLAKIRAIPDSIKDALIHSYLDKCKHQNAIEFFDWHRKLQGKM